MSRRAKNAQSSYYKVREARHTQQNEICGYARVISKEWSRIRD